MARSNGDAEPAPAGPVALSPSVPYVFGRPTLYRAKYCTRVVELGARGYSLAMIAFDLGVDRATIGRWAEKYADFCSALTQARASSLAWWEAQGTAGIWSKDFNAAAYRLQVLNRFPDDWSDRQTVELRGALANLDMNRLSDEQIARIGAGEPVMAVLASSVERLALPAGPPAASEPEPESPPG